MTLSRDINQPVTLRVIQDAPERRFSDPATARIRRLGMDGLQIETSFLQVDGLHISYNESPAQKNRIYLEWDLPLAKSVKAVGETRWYEKLGGSGTRYLADIRFLKVSAEGHAAIRGFLEEIPSRRISLSPRVERSHRLGGAMALEIEEEPRAARYYGPLR